MSATKSNATHATEVRKRKAGGVTLRNLGADPRLFELSYSSTKGAEHEIRACALWEYARSSKHLVRRIKQLQKNGGADFLDPLEPFVKILGPNPAQFLVSLETAKRSRATQSFSFPTLDWFALSPMPRRGRRTSRSCSVDRASSMATGASNILPQGSFYRFQFRTQKDLPEILQLLSDAIGKRAWKG